MAKRNDFLEGFLKGLYQSGVGNPEVQRANEADVQNRNAALTAKMAEQGMVPNQAQPTMEQKVGGFISSMFGGSSSSPMLASSFKADPNQPVSTINAQGVGALNPPGYIPKATEFKRPMKEVIPFIKTQASRAATPSLTWDQATPEQQNLAKSLYEGRIRTSDLSFRDRGATTTLANEYAIKSGLSPFKAYRGDVAAGTAKNFAYGKFGQNVNSLNTALGHVGSVYDAFQGIDNTDVRLLNTPINKIKEQTNDPAVIKLDIALNALRGELATVFKGSGGTDQEIGSWREFLDKDLSPNQAIGAMQEIDDLLRSRQQALEYQRESGFGGGTNPLVSPKASKTREKINPLKPKSSGGDPLGIR